MLLLDGLQRDHGQFQNGHVQDVHGRVQNDHGLVQNDHGHVRNDHGHVQNDHGYLQMVEQPSVLPHEYDLNGRDHLQDVPHEYGVLWLLHRDGPLMMLVAHWRY